MASKSAAGDAAEEVFDTKEVIEAVARETAELLRHAKHAIVFTGAGISTSCGIPDYRGPNGKWTRLGKGLKPISGTSVFAAAPSLTHMSIRALVDAGVLKAVISQNTDGLHARSGLPSNTLIELHGNSWKPICWGCKHSILFNRPIPSLRRRDCADCRRHVPKLCHCTGIACPRCGAMMKTSIINFEENLDEAVITAGSDHARRADVCIALGSSLSVTPAADMPLDVSTHGKLVIVNLQSTVLDEHATLVCHARVDDFMQRVMVNLGIKVPLWKALSEAEACPAVASPAAAASGAPEAVVGSAEAAASVAAVTNDMAALSVGSKV